MIPLAYHHFYYFARKKISSPVKSGRFPVAQYFNATYQSSGDPNEVSKDKKDEISVSTFVIPHDKKRSKGGEDAFFISNDGTLMGVFDGVGGWADEGIDPRDYSNGLSQGSKIATDTNKIRDPQEVLRT